MTIVEIESGLKDALNAIEPCWVGQIGATIPAIKLLHVEQYLKLQLNQLYADAFSDPEATHASS